MASEFLPLTVPLVGAEVDPVIGSRVVLVSEGKLSEAAWAIWLAHFYPGRDQALVVGNLPRACYDEAHGHPGVTAATIADDVAMHAVFMLVQLTRPVAQSDRVSNQASLDVVVAQSRLWRSWDLVTVTLHGSPAPAWAFAFAGCWVLIIEADPNSHLIVIGRGTRPADTRLVRVTSRAYGFDAHQPVPRAGVGNPDMRSVLAASAATEIHPDWLPLLA